MMGWCPGGGGQVRCRVGEDMGRFALSSGPKMLVRNFNQIAQLPDPRAATSRLHLSQKEASPAQPPGVSHVFASARAERESFGPESWRCTRRVFTASLTRAVTAGTRIGQSIAGLS